MPASASLPRRHGAVPARAGGRSIHAVDELNIRVLVFHIVQTAAVAPVLILVLALAAVLVLALILALVSTLTIRVALPLGLPIELIALPL